MSIAASTLLLPAPDAAWRLWKPKATSADRSVEIPSDVQVKGKPLVIGLPATACRSIGLILPNADHEVLEQIIITQLDRRGLKLVGGTERNFRWHLLSQTASSATVSVDALVDPFPADLALSQASDYTAALRLQSLPAGQIVITEEQGSLVLAAGYQGKLYHSHIISPSTTMALDDMAQEILLARLSLEGDLGESLFSGIVLAGQTWDKILVESLQDSTGMTVRTVPQLPPHTDLETQSWPKLLPAVVREVQRSAAQRGKLLRFGALGGMLAASLLFLAVVYLRAQETQAAKLQASVDATTAPAAKVRRTADMWKVLMPAIEAKRYPMVLLAEVTKLMPPSGIVIRRFQLKDNEIDLQGEARDAQTAVQFMEDLQKHPVLSRYTWSKPSPNVKDGAAQFRTQGKAQP
ncbi:MAG: PilN domain-containing protein [Verrucomicrobiota bacterium]